MNGIQQHRAVLVHLHIEQFYSMLVDFRRHIRLLRLNYQTAKLELE